MIRVSANVSKKVPIPNEQFSSQQFGASLEVEVSDADQPEVIRTRIRQLYALLNQSVDEQVAAAGNGHHTATQQPEQAPQSFIPPQMAPVPTNRVATQTGVRQGTATAHAGNNGGNGNGNGNGNGGRRRPVNATTAQQRAIFAITRALKLDLATVLADYNVADVRDLSVGDASILIDSLKKRQAAAAPVAGNGNVPY